MVENLYMRYFGMEMFSPFFLIGAELILFCLSLFITYYLTLCAVVREKRGPYSDPQHPYFYEEEDVWMAPGFINQFYEVRLTANVLS